ncbi:MAG: class I SAM-dependent rRNA methyltransferase [Solobacterium sp.]|nr:class I SAM-dependent rRNA methyltransferase [Solobacterium sp.]
MKHVVISDQGAEYQRRGQAWMYASNLVRMDEDIENGEPVEILTEAGEYLGTGLVSLNSHILVRILSRDRSLPVDETLFRKRIREAYEFRRTAEPDNPDNCRLIFGEADLLPGFLADRYNDVIVTQISSYGMEQRKDMLYRILLEELAADHQVINAVYERNDVKIRQKEGLSLYKGFWKGVSHETKIVINENGLKLNVDFENGQKTGYFLDQKSNRLLIRRAARGKRVLDCFTHTGGFALNAAYGNAAHVTAVDVSETALQQGRANARLNGLTNVEFVQADVFDYLKTCTPGSFDLIILDPPAFTKSRRTVDHAYHGYQQINLDAMNLLKQNHGYLATCSCSRYMETALFEQMLKETAAKAGVILKQVSVSQQNADHPVLWTMDETSYLKFYLFQIMTI